jgi:endonuclease III
VPRISSSGRLKAILTLLEERYGKREAFKPRPPVERALITILLKDGKERSAENAMRRIRRGFVDLNEMRVADPSELDTALGRSYPPGVGQLVCDALTAIFNYSQSMDLEALLELDVTKAETVLRRMGRMPSRVAGELLLAELHYGKLPATHGVLRVAKRVKLVRPGSMDSQVRSIRRLVSAKMTTRTYHAMEMLAERVCTPKDYDCRACSISEHCPTGQETLKKLAIQEEKERKAREAEEERLRVTRDRDRRQRAKKRAATARLKKQIQARSKKLKISTVKPKTKRRSKAKAAVPKTGTKMRQAPSTEVKPDRTKRKTRRRKTTSTPKTATPKTTTPKAATSKKTRASKAKPTRKKAASSRKK